ncbi:MAG: undecaprenyldiphospho-muramoylpentapeptide beta-N-acetylglucosaminyltransferase [Gemmatimonadaceae bacterium]|nr:undecaprenyldiphospho-muramoylpentapeptide beta-N-acetylglucosaminyltransferase [Chitinophagaceae bacterium]
MKSKIIIAGGGTGGHIFPAIAIANALQREEAGVELLFVGAKGKMEMEKVPQAGFRIKGIDIAGFNRSSMLKNMGLPFKLLKSYFQVRSIVADFMPDAVVGVGGYSSFPVLRFAQAHGIPTFIHESNSFAGKSNRMLGKRAQSIFVASYGMEKFFPAAKLKLTGNPVRKNISDSRITREEGIASFGLNPAMKTVLVTGGSLGARGINEAIDASISIFEQNNLQLIWQTGKPYGERARQASEGKVNVWTGEFITSMEYAYAAADMVVSRSGAMAIAELCVVAKPAILIPFPFAAEDHQTVNAEYLVSNNAGILIKDSEAKNRLGDAIINLAKDDAMQAQLVKHISALAVGNADEVIAKQILADLKEKQK